MRNIQESIISMLREHSARKQLAVAVCMIAIATAFAVFWSLRLSGLTLASEDPTCGMQEHTHTDACYDWVATETDGTEELESTDETETTEAIEIIETTETEEITNEASEEESAEASESASVEEDTSTTEETAAESVAAETETGTESVTETFIEDALEEVAEELTEEETESPQPGDTKVVDGVTYVYELICGLEEHVHTDECYESEASEDTESEDADETDEISLDDLNAGIATLSLDDGYEITVASDEEDDSTGESDESTSDSTSSSYYFADSTTLATAATNQDESYIVYTIIDGSYYVVSADNELVLCEYLGDATLHSDVEGYFDSATISTATTEDGIYCWTESSGIVFKCVSDGSTVDFSDYVWTLNGSAADGSTDGSGTYTLYNSENSVYLAPQDVGVSETLTSSAWWSETGKGKYYSLASDQMLIFTVKCTATTGGNGYAAFVVELTDTISGSETRYITTTSDKTAWTAGKNVSPSMTSEQSFDDVDNVSLTTGTGSAITSGTTYTVTVVRSDTKDGDEITSSTYTVSYYDANGGLYGQIEIDDSNLVADPVNVQIMAQVGTFEISAVYAVSKSVAGTENTSGTYYYDDLTVTSIATADDTGSLRGKTTLKGDFEITYTFYNAGSNSNTTDHYILGLYDGKGKYVYIWANSSYTESGGSSTATVTKSSEGGSAYPSNNNTWRSNMAAGKSTTNASYTICYVTVTRVKNVITITTTQSRKGSGSSG